MRIFLFLLFFLPGCIGILKDNENNIYGGILNKNTIWKGTITIEKDLLIPQNVELKIEKGTKILLKRSESTRTEPIFLQPETEILVRGKLYATGNKNKPILFISGEKEVSPKDWGGLVLDGGRIELSNVIIKDASTAILAIDGNIKITDCIFENNNYGFVALENSQGSLENCIIKKNKSGIIINNDKIILKNIKVTENEEGMIIKKINGKSSGFEIFRNDTGLVIPLNYLNFFIEDNKIYENKKNVFLFDTDINFNQ
ncbi:MAG: right-handed parallel beta-helix repeat-containing protein [Proteobacteria bacterium]|nr:right-handed parallel beta-helix repeat-containing protein [Pseudomonadota bacterium]